MMVQKNTTVQKAVEIKRNLSLNLSFFCRYFFVKFCYFSRLLHESAATKKITSYTLDFETNKFLIIGLKFSN